jgi:uncharacterized protein (TIGR03437 family)
VNTFTVNQINTQTFSPFTLTPNPASALPSQSVQFTVSSCANPSLPGCNVGLVPQGSVTLRIGNIYNQTLQLNGGGGVVFTVPANLFSSGVYSVALDYGQTSSFDPWAGVGSVVTGNYSYVAPTATTVSFSPSSPQTFGTAITVTATVTGTPTPTGSVQFTDSTQGALLSPVTLNGSGMASITVSNGVNPSLFPGPHTITAAYTPTNGTLFQASSGASNFTVNQINTQTFSPFTLTPNPASALPSQSVQFTVSSCGNHSLPGCNVGLVPQGSVTLRIGNIYNQTLQLNGGGVVFTVPANLFSGGVYQVALDYGATSSMDPWASFGSVITTTYTYLTTQTITFAPLANQTYGVAPFTVSATASSNLPVSFASTTQSVCTISGNTVTIVATGLCSIQASQAGNATYAPAPNVTQSFTVTAASQTITFGPLSNQTYGAAPFTVSATATSGLAVSFASTTPLVCTVSGSTVTIVGAGSCTIQATQPGNGNYSAAPAVPQSFTVGKATLTVTAVNASKVYGAPLPIFTATVSGFVNGDTQASAVTGAPSLTTTAVATSAPNAYPITAAAGTLSAANYSFAFVNGSLTIGKAATTIVFSNSGNSLTAIVSPLSPGAGTPTGTVQFLNGATVLGTITLSGSQATLTNPPAGASVTAVYSGDTNFNGASSATGVSSSQSTLSSVSITSSLNPTSLGQPVTFTITVSGSGSTSTPTGTIQLYDGTTLIATLTLSGAQATFSTASLGGGSHNIIAKYSGDSTFPTAQGIYGQVVFATATMTITATPLSAVYGSAITVTATVGPSTPPVGFSAPGGQVNFTEGNTALGSATLSSGTASFALPLLSVGTHVITGTYAGDGTWTSTARTVTVTITIASSMTNLSVALNQAGQAVLTAAVSAVAPGTGAPTGSVQFKDTLSGVVVATAPLSNGSAATNLAIAAANRPLAAFYPGDTNFQSSTSVSLPVAINGAGIPASSFAPEEVVSLFNVTGLSGDTPATLPLTTTLGGVNVKVVDSANATALAQIYGVFASSGQINLVLPKGTALGPALVTITLPRGGTLANAVMVTATAPGIFTASMTGQGVYAGQVVHVHPDGTQTIENAAVFDSKQNAYVPNPINLGPATDQVYLVLYGTGIRGASSGQVSATIGTGASTVYYAGPQPIFPGLDQVNLLVPPGLAGAGKVNVVLTVNGQAANTVTVAFQ